MLGVEKVVLISPPQTDGNGDPLPGTGTERVLEGCQVYPEYTGEETFAASTTTGRYVALLPVARSEVNAQMRARWDGSEWLIHGNPLTWKFYDGDLAATQVTLWDGKG